MTVNFPFEPADEADNMGSFDQFVIEKMMDLGSYFTRFGPNTKLILCSILHNFLLDVHV